MNSIKELFINRYGLSPENFDLFYSNITEVTRSKGEEIISKGEIHHSVYFIKKGAVRSYYINADGKEITYWFGFEGDVIASLGNFVESKPSLETIELLEDVELWKIDRSKLLDLYNTNIELANFGRQLAEIGLLEMEQQILLNQVTDAKTRYLSLIEKHPQILQRVKLGQIASYLGITQVTLSRIRAQK
ncbi:Crp/Fnr family transcriptional regulator [Flammeovirga sp. EKP202]|uniref:Crp/Fnr family transcriptional regulator n=1 Tax=Flammeovirga sp. EKP202 TaxID=2770592 RepID=UPI00165F34CD|nr:Crp/Fnr family transcriptional regulator [Flammeovirga sp. EKP202]MBD0404244.1 Crp/Fnr family transcriptional regulator [Flammeovirga sp. EKP202]